MHYPTWTVPVGISCQWQTDSNFFFFFFQFPKKIPCFNCKCFIALEQQDKNNIFLLAELYNSAMLLMAWHLSWESPLWCGCWSSGWNCQPRPSRSQNWMFVHSIIILSRSQQFPTSSSQNKVELGKWATGHFMHCEGCYILFKWLWYSHHYENKYM